MGQRVPGVSVPIRNSKANFDSYEENPYFVVYEQLVREERRANVGAQAWEVRASVARRYPHLTTAAWSKTPAEAFVAAVEHHMREDASTIDEAYQLASQRLPGGAEAVSLSNWKR